MERIRAAIGALLLLSMYCVNAGEVALQSRTDATGMTTYWGTGAHYEITGPGVTVFFLRGEDGTPRAPLVRVAYVGADWINVRSVTFTVGGRTFGPYADGFGDAARVEAGNALVVEALIFPVDSDEKWQMLEGIAESAELGRPVIAVFDADAPYGIELDRAAMRATGRLVEGFREISVRSH